MPYKTFTHEDVTVVSVDLQGMAGMSVEEYRRYLRENLLWVDHHDILRSKPAQYPIAATKEQLKELVAYLHELEPKIGEH